MKSSHWQTLGILALSLPALARDGQQAEPELDCSAASEPYQLIYGMHTVNASISPATDLDVFEFVGEGGETALICIDGQSNNFDPWIRIFDPTGIEMDSTLCSAGTFDTCSVCLSVVIPDPGIYTVVIGDAGVNNPGSYVLQLERVLPTTGVPVLPYNFSDQEVISPATDIDWVTFHGQAGSNIQILVDGQTNNFDPNITLFGPDGSTVGSNSCSAGTFDTCSVSLSATLQVDGTYYLQIRDAGVNNTGSYTMSTTCIFGCPTPWVSMTRNGSGINPVLYTNTRPPVPGGCLAAEINTNPFPDASVAGFLFYREPLDGLMTVFGELLVDLGSPKVLSHFVFWPSFDEGIARMALPLANDLSLVGFSTSSQGVVLEVNDDMSKEIHLLNAIDYVLGH